MQYIKLTMTFLDKTTDIKIKDVYKNFEDKGRTLGELTIKTKDKIKTLTITPSEIEKFEEQEKSINDFTTQLVNDFKIESIATEELNEN